ncbi:unnamed protein product [Paramecium sonneborni]|uniref:Uncharacterized protein n=1 Tax=Paramecium sonneborni TaxID=65129 RepID=A0A8S1R805_9CILI|nr:unnamed protein product [Paramecium sonneborni]
MNIKYKPLQGWQQYSISNYPTNQLKLLSESLNYTNTFPNQNHIKLHQSVSPKKHPIQQCYLQKSIIIDQNNILSQKQHYLQSNFIKKVQFSPKKQIKHSYIGPLLQEIKIYQKNKQIGKNDSIIKQLTK